MGAPGRPSCLGDPSGSLLTLAVQAANEAIRDRWSFGALGSISRAHLMSFALTVPSTQILRIRLGTVRAY